MKLWGSSLPACKRWPVRKRSSAYAPLSWPTPTGN